MATTRSAGFKVTATIWNALFSNLTDAGLWQGFTWEAVPYSSGNFTGNGSMTWTVDSGDVALNRYVVMGKTMVWSVALVTTTIGGTPNTTLNIAIPGGYTAVSTGNHARVARCANNGSLVEASVLVGSSSAISIVLNTFGNWAAGTNNNEFSFQLIFEIA